jgi:hypothetical protein
MPSRSSKSVTHQQRTRPDRGRIIETARSQHGLISRPQLVDSGFSSRAIHGWKEKQHLLPAGRSVYALGRQIEGLQASCMAASMIVGEGAAVSGRAAARLWGIDNRYQGEVTVAHQKGRRPAEFWLDPRGVSKPSRVRVRRSRNLDPGRITRKFGIPVLRPSWLLLDLAGDLPPDAFGRIFKEADRLHILREDELRACADQGSGFPGVDEFRKLVARRHPDSKDARTLLEVLFLEICAEYGIETPVVNRPKGRYYPDFGWEEIKLIVEVDGYEGHAGRLAFLDDAARENELRALGYQVLRFTWEEVTQQPQKVARLVIGEIARCRALAGLL